MKRNYTCTHFTPPPRFIGKILGFHTNFFGAASKIQDKAFTLAEVLITLAIIGVVAALTIPSVIANTQQAEFKTGLRKAVSVLNSAITMNIALDGESPYENSNLYDYLMRHMSVMRSTTRLEYTLGIKSTRVESGVWRIHNVVFYTTDGMRYEFGNSSHLVSFPLYESEDIKACVVTGLSQWSNKPPAGVADKMVCARCGSYGLNDNSDGTTSPPCILTVDVNGDRKPNPKNVSCKSDSCIKENMMKFADPEGKRLTDLFSIMITDKKAVPYGTAAQKAMYESQK